MVSISPPQGFGGNVNKKQIDEIHAMVTELGIKQDQANYTLIKIASIVSKIHVGDQMNGEILTEMQQLLKNWINPDDENPNNI